jgi:hypothetical protein
LETEWKWQKCLAGADKAWKTNPVPKMKRTKKLLTMSITTAYYSNNSYLF